MAPKLINNDLNILCNMSDFATNPITFLSVYPLSNNYYFVIMQKND